MVAVIIAFFLGNKKAVLPATQDTGNSTFVLSDGTYKVDPSVSTIKWSGEYSTGSTEDGVVSLSSGTVSVVSGMPSTGNFQIDLDSITDSSGNTVFLNYLKAKDALAVDDYPMATFKINKVLPNPVSGTTTGKYIIDGLLTVKDKTDAISLPATITTTGNTLKADSYVAINLLDWGVKSTPLVGNSVIIEMHIEASK